MKYLNNFEEYFDFLKKKEKKEKKDVSFDVIENIKDITK
jgi:hypothetical protein